MHYLDVFYIHHESRNLAQSNQAVGGRVHVHTGFGVAPHELKLSVRNIEQDRGAVLPFSELLGLGAEVFESLVKPPPQLPLLFFLLKLIEISHLPPVISVGVKVIILVAYLLVK